MTKQHGVTQKGLHIQGIIIHHALYQQPCWHFHTKCGCKYGDLKCLREVSSERIVEVQMAADYITPQFHFMATEFGLAYGPTVGTELVKNTYLIFI